MSRIPGEDYHPPHGAKATTPTADAIARVLVDQDRELAALRSALAQQTERAERAAAQVHSVRAEVNAEERRADRWRARTDRAEAGLREAMARAHRAELAEHHLEATLDRVRELRNEAEAQPGAYLIDRDALDTALEEGK
jgi:hypothetical protein